MNIQSASYSQKPNGDADTSLIVVTLTNGSQMNVPAVSSNRHYVEIMALVDAGELTISEP
jgi:ribosomal protein L30E